LFSRRSGRVSFGILGALLEDNERVDVLVQGRLLGEEGACVLTDRRVLLVNGREWKPDVLQLDVIAGLMVQGWQDDRVASLVFQTGGAAVTIDQIAEREMAQRLAASLRSRIPMA
jgi:hypothetical protein